MMIYVSVYVYTWASRPAEGVTASRFASAAHHVIAKAKAKAKRPLGGALLASPPPRLPAYSDRQANRQAGRQADRQNYRQTDKQADRH